MKIKSFIAIIILTLLSKSLSQGESQALFLVAKVSDYGGSLIGTTSYEYDSRGNLVTTIETLSSIYEYGFAFKTIVNYTYSDHGQMLTSTEERDYYADGFPDERLTTAYRELPGNQMEEIRELDANLDGVVDTVENVITTFDKKGRIVFQVLENSYQGYIPQFRSVDSVVYDDKNNQYLETYEFDHYGFGFSDYRYQALVTTDKSGKPLALTYEADVDIDGIIDETGTIRFISDYGQSGNLLKELIEFSYETEAGQTFSTTTNRFVYERRKQALGPRSGRNGKTSERLRDLLPRLP